MNRKSLYTRIGLLFVVILILHSAALYFHIYWTMPSFDLLMHFMAGLLIGLVVYLGYEMALKERIYEDPNNLFLLTIFTVITAGIAWEVYEYATGMTYSNGQYALDAAIDMTFNITGGVVAYGYVRSHFRSERQ